MRYEGGQFFVKSEEQMRKLFLYALSAVENTQKIADRCNVTLEFGNYKIPKYKVPDGYSSAGRNFFYRTLRKKDLKRNIPAVVSMGRNSLKKSIRIWNMSLE